MNRFMFGACLLLLVAFCVGPATASSIHGHYMEARTCQIYTGPCFANGEVGLTGKDAVMAWNIQDGRLNGTDLSGLSVAVVVRSKTTLGFNGLNDGKSLRAIIVVDSKASSDQRTALVNFAKSQSGKAAQCVEHVKVAAFDMKMDVEEVTGNLTVGNIVKLQARKARPSDCICSNESAYYPPLAKLEGFVPGVTIDGQVKARGLGTRWSIPDSRSSYLGTFSVQ